MKMKTIPAAMVAAGLLSAGAAGAFSLSDWFGSKDKTAPTAETRIQTAAAPAAAPAPIAALAPSAVPNFRAIVQQYGPAVVGVTIEGTRKVTTDDLPDEFQNDPFFQFFRGLPGFRFRIPRGEMPIHGQGSGFIVSPDGVILTNAHVVRDAKEVTVKLNDRREFRAKVLGADPATDVAVLRIDAKNLTTVRIGDPKQLQVGDYVLAIGAPFGFEQSATSGIVSAKGRSLPGDSYVPFIQTDAAVNPGNSGGPLFDAAGNVVGINAQIYSQTGGYQGLSFAIPIDVALHAKDQIVAKGRVDHARLGVMLQDLNQTLAESFGLKRPDGALIANVEPDSAAANAGLKSGDVIAQIDGKPVERSSDVSSRVGLAAPGEKVKLTVWRERATREVEVKLGAVRDEKSARRASADDGDRGRLGLAVRPLSSDDRRALRADHGLVVEDVDGPAARAGIQPGDVVLAVNGRDLTSVDQLRRALEGKPKSVALLILRDGARIFVPVRLG
jgi:serine protease Do